MHSLLCPCEAGFIPDHKDGDGLNNRRANLRPATYGQNLQNRSAPAKRGGAFVQFKGVCWNKRRQKWASYINVGGKRLHLGVHADEADAARNYDAAALKYHGKFARLNFPKAVCA